MSVEERGDGGGTKEESSRAVADDLPIFQLTLDQPTGLYVHEPTPHSFRLRLIFSVGAFARFDAVVYNYFAISFLMKNAFLSPFYAGLILTTSKVLDAFTDPFVGALSDQTISRFGRRLPWIFSAVCPLMCFWVLRWLVIPDLIGHPLWQSLYFFIVISFYSFARTCQEIPYRALIPDVATTYEQRSQMSLLMTEMDQIASVLGILLFVFFTIEGGAYWVPAAISAVFCGVPRFLASYFVSERKVDFFGSALESKRENSFLLTSPSPFPDRPKSPLFAYLSAVLKAFLFKDFLIVCLVLFILNFSNILHQSTLIFLIRQIYDNNTLSPYIVFGEQAVGLISLPIWLLFINRFGKKKSFYLSAFFLVCLFIPLMFPLGLIPFTILICLIGISNATSMVVQAMIPDTIQAYETFSGRRDEGFLSSLCLFVTKIGSAVASLVVSSSFGVAEKVGDVTEETTYLYRLVCFGVPAIGLLIGTIVMFFAEDYSKPENFTFPFTTPPEDSEDFEFDLPHSHRGM